MAASGFPPVPPTATGSVEYDVFALAVALGRIGNEVYIIDTWDNSGRNLQALNEFGLERLYRVTHPRLFSKLAYGGGHFLVREVIKHGTQISFGVFSSSALAKFVMEGKCEIFNPHSRYPGFFAYIMKKLFSLRLPWVFSTHTSLWIRQRMSLTMKSFLFPETICFRLSSHVTSVSETLRKYVIKHVGLSPERITTIPNGVDSSVFRPMQKTLIGKKQSGPMILYISSISRSKNQAAAIRTLHELVKEHSDVRLVLVGAVYDLEYYKYLLHLSKKLDVEKNLSYLGERKMFDIPKYLNNADIFLLPTTLESAFPRVLMEALSCGKPSVVSNIPTITEKLEKNVAIVVDPADIRGMTRAVISILEDENLRRKLENNSRKFAMERFDWLSIAKEYERVFSDSILQ